MKKKTIKVGLTTARHGINREITKFPPKGVKFLSIKPIPNFLLTGNLQYYEEKECDLLDVLDFPCFTKNKWIYQCYSAGGLGAYTLFGLYISRNSRIELTKGLLARDNLKRIIIGSNAATKDIQRYAKINDSKILDKMIVVYPGIRQIDDSVLQRKKKGQKINILFVGIDFVRKGGMQLLDAFEMLQKKFDNLQLTVVSFFCDGIERQFDPGKKREIAKRKIANNPDIVFVRKPEREVIFNQYYPKADIFILPTMEESFGLALVEAQAFGLPVVATDIYAIPEIVESNKSGLLIKVKNNKFIKKPNRFSNKKGQYIIPKDLNDQLTEGIYSKLKLLIEDNSLREKLGKEGLKIARTKFSVQKRNKSIKKIYEKAIE